jgi:F-type H+-transporting ATPase subunit alpha
MIDHEIRNVEMQAYVYSAKAPSKEQSLKLQEYLEKKYEQNVALVWKEEKTLAQGFRIEIGTAVYKWNL